MTKKKKKMLETSVKGVSVEKDSNSCSKSGQFGFLKTFIQVFTVVWLLLVHMLQRTG